MRVLCKETISDIGTIYKRIDRQRHTSKTVSPCLFIQKREVIVSPPRFYPKGIRFIPEIGPFYRLVQRIFCTFVVVQFQPVDQIGFCFPIEICSQVGKLKFFRCTVIFIPYTPFDTMGIEIFGPIFCDTVNTIVKVCFFLLRGEVNSRVSPSQ